MPDTARRLRPLDGIVIFAVSYLASIVVAALLRNVIPPRVNAAIMSCMLIGVSALFLRLTTGSPVRCVHFRRVKPSIVFYSVVASLALILPALSVEVIVIHYVEIPDEVMEALMELLRAHTLPELLYVWLVSAVAAGVSEEFVFRGILQNSLTGWVRGWGAVVIASLVFGLLHTIWRLPPAFILGAFLGFLYLRTGSIVPSIVCHVVNNSVAVVTVYVAEVYGEQAAPAWLIDEQAAPALLLGISLIIFWIAVGLILKGTPGRRGQDGSDTTGALQADAGLGDL
jgi:membrane protease YdiL (CAAX protease family)